MAGSVGRITVTTRAAYDIVQDADVTKYEGQENIEQVAGLFNALAERVVSRPPTTGGCRQVFNIYWDTNIEELVIEISETDT